MTTTQTPVNIGTVIQNAVVFDFKQWSGGAMNSDSLPQAVDHLFALLEQQVFREQQVDLQTLELAAGEVRIVTRNRDLR